MQPLFIPISLTLGTVVFGLAGAWYVLPALRRLSRDEAPIPLILPHGLRYIGLAFLVPGVTSQALDPRFADPAAWGDLAAAVFAILAVVALRKKWSSAILLTWAFNIFGTLDLLNALFQGTRYNQPMAMGATYFIPAVAVPLLLVLHVMIFRLLVSAPYNQPAGREDVVDLSSEEV